MGGTSPGDDPMVTMLRAAMSDPGRRGPDRRDVPRAGHRADWRQFLACSGPPGSAPRPSSSFIKGSLIDRYVLRQHRCWEPPTSSQDFADYLGSVLQQLLTGPSPGRLS